MHGVSSPIVATERQIKSAANKSRSLSSMLSNLNYESSHPGGNTIKRFKRILGNAVYAEIASGNRRQLTKSKWTKS